jgi:hypothetical protein
MFAPVDWNLKNGGVVNDVFVRAGKYPDFPAYFACAAENLEIAVCSLSYPSSASAIR